MATETKEQIWIHPIKPNSNEQFTLNYSLNQVPSGGVVQNYLKIKKKFQFIYPVIIVTINTNHSYNDLIQALFPGYIWSTGNGDPLFLMITCLYHTTSSVKKCLHQNNVKCPLFKVFSIFSQYFLRKKIMYCPWYFVSS